MDSNAPLEPEDIEWVMESIALLNDEGYKVTEVNYVRKNANGGVAFDFEMVEPDS